MSTFRAFPWSVPLSELTARQEFVISGGCGQTAKTQQTSGCAERVLVLTIALEPALMSYPLSTQGL